MRWADAPAAIAGPGDYPALGAVTWLLPLRITTARAPEVPRFTAMLKISDLGRAYDWGAEVHADDLCDVAMDPSAGGPTYLFAGFVVDVEWADGGGDEFARVTLEGKASRLLKDVVVHGRHVDNKDAAVTHYTGMPAVFNKGGRPNMDKDAYHPSNRVFTADDQAGADYWTAPCAFAYLLNRWNSAETWIHNPIWLSFDFATDTKHLPPLNVEGLSLWEALARVADVAGYDVYEAVVTATGASIVRVKAIGAGSAITVKRQDGGAMAAANTNLFACRVAHNFGAAVARPLLAGATRIIETTFELGKAWNSSDLDWSGIAAEGGVIDSDLDTYSTVEYVKRHTVGGSDFEDYADVGRLWDASTDGKFSEAPYSITTPDVGDLATGVANAWPVMAHRPMPMLTQMGAASLRSRQVWVEYTIDGGTNWHHLAGGYRVLPDRVAVYLTQRNLADIYPKGADSRAKNLFYMLGTDAANVKMRITCCIASPTRQTSQPARRAGYCATKFSTARYIDVGGLGASRSVASGSRFYGATDADEIDQSTALDNRATAYQSRLDASSIEANLPRAWVDEAVAIGDHVVTIAGIAYSLATGLGETYPRVVAIETDLTTDTYATSLLLDSGRQGGAR